MQPGGLAIGAAASGTIRRLRFGAESPEGPSKAQGLAGGAFSFVLGLVAGAGGATGFSLELGAGFPSATRLRALAGPEALVLAPGDASLGAPLAAALLSAGPDGAGPASEGGAEGVASFSAAGSEAATLSLRMGTGLSSGSSSPYTGLELGGVAAFGAHATAVLRSTVVEESAVRVQSEEIQRFMGGTF